MQVQIISVIIYLLQNCTTSYKIILQKNCVKSFLYNISKQSIGSIILTKYIIGNIFYYTTGIMSKIINENNGDNSI